MNNYLVLDRFISEQLIPAFLNVPTVYTLQVLSLCRIVNLNPNKVRYIIYLYFEQTNE